MQPNEIINSTREWRRRCALCNVIDMASDRLLMQTH